jgi:RHS repeat-associated protein
LIVSSVLTALAGMTYGNGQVFSQTQTLRQLPDRVRSVKGTDVPVDLTYTYNPRDQIASINDQSPANIDQSFTYDRVGRLTAGTGPWGASTFSYDTIGNLLQRQVGTRTVALSYNASNNRLASHTDTAGAPPTPVTGTYAYDGHLRRAKQVVGGVTRYSVYDVSGGLVSIDQAGAGPTEYIRASGMVLARVAGAAVTWLHPDHLGSAVAGTGPTGAVVWRESEQPFGEDWTSAPANDNQAGYTGHVEDAATDLVYMQARYYNPVIGRFLANDPVRFSPGRPDMFNRYAYAGNDPVNNWDPDGRIFGLIGKGVKLVIKGGDVGATLAGAATDAKAVFAPAGTSTAGARALAAASLASEIVSPVSGRDAKAGLEAAGDALEGATKGLRRPYIRVGTREKVEADAPRTSDGRAIDPNTGNPIDGKPDMGHKPGREFRKEKAKAEAQGMSQKEFNDQQNDPDIYQLEDRSSNRSRKFEEPG